MRQPVFVVVSRVVVVATLWLAGGCVQAPPAPAPPMADRVVVEKSQRLLELMRDGRAFATFRIALGRNSLGTKQWEGDGRTPEGLYRIDWRLPQSRYTRALHISYPDENDRARAAAMGVDPGGAIFIHGLPPEYGSSEPPYDWTEGCVSVGNVAIAQIWDAVPDGTPVEIRP